MGMRQPKLECKTNFYQRARPNMLERAKRAAEGFEPGAKA